ncbi:hypothetical protein [Paenibacillus sp. NPDC058174]
MGDAWCDYGKSSVELGQQRTLKLLIKAKRVRQSEEERKKEKERRS